MKSDYEPLIRTIEGAGFFTNGIETNDYWDRLLISTLSGSGKSFWVSHFEGDWIVGGWSGLTYLLSEGNRLGSFCLAVLQGGFNESGSDFAAHIKAEYALILQKLDDS